MNTERIRVMIADAGYEMLGRQLEAIMGRDSTSFAVRRMATRCMIRCCRHSRMCC